MDLRTNIISNFLKTMHDYDPVSDDKSKRVVGCYNTKYHGNLFQATIFPPITKMDMYSYPTTVICYILLDDGEIALYCEDSNTYKLSKCIGASLDNVYNEIIEAEKLKKEYDINTKNEE